jgi:hypothetical protein
MADNVGLEKFFLADYEQVAKAYFDQHKRFADFFKFYLTIMTVPTSVVVYLVKEGSFSLDQLGLAVSSVPLAALFLVLAMVGFMMMMILINIRFEILRHARQVNLIRGYFRDHVALKPEIAEQYFLFPPRGDYPRFKETKFGSMKSVVSCMAVINSSVAVPFFWTITGWILQASPRLRSELVHNLLIFAMWAATIWIHRYSYEARSSGEELLYACDQRRPPTSNSKANNLTA